ncbi:hypothetical protein DL98DRAFT_469453 [Cadophora sp. DSE1049]|nr:hypothetical protein DL98DRAFT_469453 [Cadophora sp. DSE1049]
MDISQPSSSIQQPSGEQPARSTSVKPPESTPAAARPFKRPRLKLACQICRDRKIRCDGARPVCDSCSRKRYSAVQCIYPGHEVEQTESYVASLEERVRELESRRLNEPLYGNRTIQVPIVSPREAQDTSSRNVQAAVPSSSGTLLPSPTGSGFTPRGSQPVTSPSGQVISPGSHSLPAAGHNSGYQQHRSYNYDSRSGLRNHGRDDDTHSVLGASSAVGFMKEVHSVFEGDGQDASAMNYDTPGSTDTFLPATSIWFDDRSEDDGLQYAMQEFLLPPRRTADELLHLYFNIVHPEMPVFYKPPFLQRYERLWTAGSTPLDSQDRTLGIQSKATTSDLLFHCMLDVIFALGHVVRSLKTCTSSASAQQIFIKRVNRMLTLDLIGKPSLQLVHTLILMARYYQHQGLSNRNWIMVGMLIRIAQALGLHVDVPGESQAQREERRRTWCACTTLDSIQSMTFGRPLMLSSQSLPPLPRVIDDQYLCTDPQGPDGVQPEGTRSELAFFIYAMKLSQISGRTLRTFFKTSTDSEAGVQVHESVGSVLELDSLLQNFCDELPPYLKPNQPQTLEADSFFARQASWLQIRVLQIRMTIFRGVVIRLATKPLSRNQASLTSLQRHLTMGCIDACASASGKIIDLIHEYAVIANKPDFVQPPWYTTLLMYTAGTVLVVILRAPTLRNMLTTEKQREIQSSWGICLKNLEHYHRIGIVVAAKCIATLRKIYEDGELERRQRSGDKLNTPQHADTNIETGPKRFQDHLESSHSMGESQLWDLIDTEMPESWWASGDMEWLDNLVDFGYPSGEGDESNTPMTLYN